MDSVEDTSKPAPATTACSGAELLADMYKVWPALEVDAALKAMLVVMRTSVPERATEKRRKEQVAVGAQVQLAPWKPGDELPKKTCWYKRIDCSEVDFKSHPRVQKSWYDVVHKIVEKGVDPQLDEDRENLLYEEAPVHENVNLQNPGEEAWLVHSWNEMDFFRGIFHTQEEAELAAEHWEEEVIQKGKEKGEEWDIETCVVKVRVEHSVEELFAEKEDRKIRDRALLPVCIS